MKSKILPTSDFVASKFTNLTKGKILGFFVDYFHNNTIKYFSRFLF